MTVKRVIFMEALFHQLASSTKALDLKGAFFNQNVSIFFLFLEENIHCGYSLEVPLQGASNEYPQHMFSLRNKNTVYLIPHLN